ncbi:hypothetical protein HZB88_04535, partial [archaeon]|nr:hypothetical protein [archaeon]
MKGKQKKLLLLAYLFIACLLVAIAISAVSAAKFSKASFSDLKSTKYMPFPEEWKKARWEIRNCPRISSIADIEISEGEPASFSISASDPNGNPLSYRVSESYSNVEFSQSGNTFSWQTEEGDAETYTITAYASDG